MDFAVTYTEAQERFRAEVRSWLDANVPEAIRFQDVKAGESHESYLQRRKLGRRLGAQRWLFPTSPTEYGGGGLDTDSALVLMEELNRLGLGLPPYYDSGGVLGSVAILVWGTEEQKLKFLPPIYSGEVRTWQLLTEPEAGSDVANVRTLAVRDGDDYLVTGQKVFVGSDHGADRLWTLVRTDPNGKRHHNLGWLMIDASSPGISITPMQLIGGIEKYSVFLDNVRVPADALIGGENRGWEVAATHLDLEHGFRSDAILSYQAQRQWNSLLSHCRTGEVGSRIVDDPRARELLGEAYVRREIQRLWGLRNFWLTRSGGKRSYEGAQAYYFEKVTDNMMAKSVTDIVGPSALLWDHEAGAAEGAIGRQLATAIGASHGGGTVDIQRVVISRHLGIGRPVADDRPASA